jgi:hypothetical protein
MLMEKFKHEEKFLTYINEKTEELCSIIELLDGHGLTPESLLTKPKFTSYLLDGKQFSDGVVYLDSIFVFDNDIYMYLSKSDIIVSSFSCKIYYPIRKKKDVDFFILNLKKIKKDGN